jgi:hypothetical protein
MPEPKTRLEDLPPREQAAWRRGFEILAAAAERKAQAEAKAKEAAAG